MAQHYKHKTTGVVVTVAEDSALEELVTASGSYEPATADDVATDVPALAARTASSAERDESNGWLTPPGVAPAPITGAVAAPAAPADPLEEVLKGTAEDVNSYLDEHPADAPRVLELEAAGKQRKTVLEGRHAPAPAPAE